MWVSFRVVIHIGSRDGTYTVHLTHTRWGEGSPGTSVFELAGDIGFPHIFWQVMLEDVLIFVLFSATESYYVDQAGLDLNGSLSSFC